MKKWTPETAKKYIENVQNGKAKEGLTYLSAKDYLKNHTKKDN